jgi:hypothetical protein
VVDGTIRFPAFMFGVSGKPPYVRLKKSLAIKRGPCHTRSPKLRRLPFEPSAQASFHIPFLGESDEKLIETESVICIVLALGAALLGSFADESVYPNLALNRGGERAYTRASTCSLCRHRC